MLFGDDEKRTAKVKFKMNTVCSCEIETLQPILVSTTIKMCD